jgi:RNase adaptor protein for sRNA GlmZ degradation
VATIEILSFGYGHGPAPEAHLTIDLRHHFRDPHVNPALRGLTANDRQVRRAVLATPGVRRMLAATVRQVQALAAGPTPGTITVAFGCVGGRHRSAVAAQNLARRLTRRGHTVTLHHRDLHQPVINH